MKTSGVIHPGLLDLIAAAGHGDLIVLADAGLRIPSDKLRIDLGLTCGVPTMAQVLGAVKQDLVISAYKPNGGLEDRFRKAAGNEESAWDFVRSHLKYLPTVKLKGSELEFIAERDPRVIFL